MAEMQRELAIWQNVDKIYDEFLAFYTAKYPSHLSTEELTFIRQRIEYFVRKSPSNMGLNAFKKSMETSTEQLPGKFIYQLVEQPNGFSSVAKRPRTWGNVFK